MKKILAAIAVFMVFCALGNNVSAADIEVDLDVTLSSSSSDRGDDDETFTAGDTFYVHLRLRNDDSEDLLTTHDIDVEILFDGIKVFDDTVNLAATLAANEVAYINFSSSRFNYNDDYFKEMFLAYKCGENMDVEVRIGDDVEETESVADLTIEADDDDEGDIDLTMTPSDPGSDSDIVFKTEDGDNNELKSAKVEVWNLGEDDEWDDSDENWHDNTDSDGETDVLQPDDEFDEVEGNYIAVAYKSGYCRDTLEFDISKNLIVSNPDPVTPQAGKSFKIRVTNEGGNPVQGALATLSGGANPIRSHSDVNGYATFTVQNEGSYSLVVARSGYTTSTIKTITVSKKPPLTVSASNTKPTVGESITITVKTEGANLEGATVKITTPDGTSTSPATGSSGTISYTPTVSGVYQIKTSKSGYGDATAAFTAESIFNIEIPDNKKKIFDQKTKIIVKDGSANAVSGTAVSISGTSISGTTDVSGEFEFKAPEPGTYTITVSKSGFSKKEATLSVAGTLTLEITPKQANLGENIEIKVLNDAGKPITAEITVTHPDGTSDVQEIDTLVFTKDASGEFAVTATKADFDPATGTFSIQARELRLNAVFEKDELTVTALSDGQAVSALTIQVETPTGEVKTAVTDADGTIMMAAEKKGDYKISAVSGVYDSGEVTAVKKGLNWWLIVLALLILVAGAVFAIVGIIHARKRKRRGNFDNIGKSKLQR